MSISGISGNPASFYAQRRQDFQALASAVNAGNIGQAQQALGALQATAPANQTASASGSQTSSQVSGRGPGFQIKTDFSALSSAVQSGDIAGAQNALASLQTGFSGAKSRRGCRLPILSIAVLPGSEFAVAGRSIWKPLRCHTGCDSGAKRSAECRGWNSHAKRKPNFSSASPLPPPPRRGK